MTSSSSTADNGARETATKVPDGVAGLERPFHFITVVWGKTFCETFLEYCVASLLSPGNLPALQTRQRSKFVIATLPDDWRRMSATPIFREIEKYVEPVFIEIPPCPPGKSGCEHMGVGHKAACQLAHDEKAYAVIFTPDCMISDGTVRQLQQHAKQGIELVWVPALRFAEEPFLGHLRAWGLIADESRQHTCTPLAITGADMVNAAINGLHTETLSYEWDASYFAELPSAVWWRVPGENGIVVYCLSWAPFLLDFGAIKSHDTTTLENWTIDGDYVFKNLGPSPKAYVVQDSDEMFYSSWATIADRAIKLQPRYISRYRWVNFDAKVEVFRRSFYGPVFDPLKRQMFSIPLRWHSNPINARWWPVERRSQRILHFCLGEGFVGLSRVRILGSNLSRYSFPGSTLSGLSILDSVRVNLARAYFRLASACFNLALKLGNTCFNLFAACSRLGMLIIRRIAGSLDSWEQYQERGIRRDKRGDYVRAVGDFSVAIAIGPPNPALHFLRGCTLLHATDRQGAAKEFEAGLKLDPDNVTLRDLLARTAWEAHQERGIQRDADGDHLGAAADFAEAIRIAPANPALHYLRGVALLHAADRQGATAEFETILKLEPNNTAVRGLLDRTVWETLQERGIKRDADGDHLGAAEDFAEAIQNGSGQSGIALFARHRVATRSRPARRCGRIRGWFKDRSKKHNPPQSAR